MKLHLEPYRYCLFLRPLTQFQAMKIIVILSPPLTSCQQRRKSNATVPTNYWLAHLACRNGTALMGQFSPTGGLEHPQATPNPQRPEYSRNFREQLQWKSKWDAFASTFSVCKPAWWHCLTMSHMKSSAWLRFPKSLKDWKQASSTSETTRSSALRHLSKSMPLRLQE